MSTHIAWRLYADLAYNLGVARAHDEPRWEEARDLFLDLADREPEERSRELERLAREDPELAQRVEGLLRHDEPPPGPEVEERPLRFGPYEALRLIGRGGMGEVHVARRADGEYDREVAVKLVREGTRNPDHVRRFLRERQMLAKLDHEYIARLLDGGTTETGEPYLVMEYVEGEPADRFAARLGPTERLELFVRIGRAVAHAHERGFVHRDLKPSNVLVRADGTPRLLDFGIARPDPRREDAEEGEPLTRTGHRLFTPEYASPEQVLGQEATAASDVFSLGVMLYGFLCGEGPWPDADSQVALERSICERDPAPPSRRLTGTARIRIGRDLDAIVLQCLEKRPERRYATAGELCDDVERHLAGLPIRARRTGPLGRAARLARRRPAVPVALALVLVALVAGGIAWTSELRSRRHREELATAVGDRVDAARARWADGDAEAADAELDAALATVRELPGEERLEAEVLVQMAVFANLRREWDRGLELLGRAREILDARGDDATADPRLRATLLNSLTYAIQSTEPGERSLAAAEEALAFAEGHLAPGDILRADALLGWADELRRTGRDDRALEVLADAVAAIRAEDPRSEELSRLLNELAIGLSRARRHGEAVACYTESLEILAWHHGARHPSFPKVRLNLGTALFRQGRHEEARTEYELALEGALRSDLEVHAAVSRTYLGILASRDGDQARAEELARAALETCERLQIPPYADRARCVLGIAEARSGRLAEARATLADLLPVGPSGTESTLAPDLEAEAREALGAALQDTGLAAEALPHLERAHALRLEQLGPDDEETRELARRVAAAR